MLEAIEDVAQDFLNREAIVNAAEFSDAVKKVKSLIYVL